MTFNKFKDLLFDIINESRLPITDIDADDLNNTFRITLRDNSQFMVSLSAEKYTKVIDLKSGDKPDIQKGSC